ncbi:hypothetical protein, partial [Aeromonas dhakensis]|uniref:hypothetical protein n=1 Tax=Aeromonas dhakensis TaxID=196024 RepID=UPI003BA276FC
KSAERIEGAIRKSFISVIHWQRGRKSGAILPQTSAENDPHTVWKKWTPSSPQTSAENDPHTVRKKWTPSSPQTSAENDPPQCGKSGRHHHRKQTPKTTCTRYGKSERHHHRKRPAHGTEKANVIITASGR